MKIKFLLFFLLLFFSVSLSASLSSVTIQGLVLINEQEKLLNKEELKKIQGVKTINLDLNEKKLEKFLFPYFHNKIFSMPNIHKIKLAIQNYYEKENRPFIWVEIPQQEIKCGILQLIIHESHIGKISVQGNKWFSNNLLIKDLHLKPHDTLSSKKLAQALHFINRNPFRRVDYLFSAGENPNTTDITLCVCERFPVRIYSGIDNEDLKTLGSNRAYGGFNWENVFNSDHVFSYQYTTALPSKRFFANTFQYLAPLDSCYHVLNIYGGYSHVSIPLDRPLKKSHGNSFQGSLRYNVPFLLSLCLLQDASLGFDYKRTNNTIEFIENFGKVAKTVALFQFVLGYTGNYQKDQLRIDFDNHLFFSPGRWLKHQTKLDYQSLRPGSSNEWLYFRGSFSYLQKIYSWAFFYLYMQAQITSHPLLPSEQIGLGGYNTIRGYEERIFNADNALIMNSELRSAPLKIISNFEKTFDDGLQFLIFLDYGYGNDKTKESDSFILPKKNAFLISTGPGARYTFGSHLTAKIDWGIKLHKRKDLGPSWQRLHFSVEASF